LLCTILDYALQPRLLRRRRPPLGRVSVRPLHYRIVVGTDVLRAPPGPGLRLALERAVRVAHEALAQVVEAVRRVVRDLLLERDVGVAGLEVLDEVGLEVGKRGGLAGE
jgi:hypothetical protein